MLDVGSQPNDRFQDFQNQDVVGGLGTVPLVTDQQGDAAEVGLAGCSKEEALPTKATELMDQKAPAESTSSACTPLPHGAHTVPLPTVLVEKSNSSSNSGSAKQAHRKPARRASIDSLLRAQLSAPLGRGADRPEGKPSSGTRISSLYGQEGRVDLSVAAEAVRCATSALTQSAKGSRAMRGASFTSQSSRAAGSSKANPPSACVHSSPLPTVLRTSPPSTRTSGSHNCLPKVASPPSPPAGSSSAPPCSSGSTVGCAEGEHTGTQGLVRNLCAPSDAGPSSSKRASVGRCERLAAAETMVEILQRTFRGMTPCQHSSAAGCPATQPVLARAGSTRTHKPVQACPWSAAGRALNEAGATKQQQQQQQQQQQSARTPVPPRGSSPARTAKSKGDQQCAQRKNPTVTGSAKPLSIMAQRA